MRVMKVGDKFLTFDIIYNIFRNDSIVEITRFGENKDKDIVYYKYLYSDQLHLLGADRYYQLEEEFVKATKFIPERYIKLMTDKNYLEIAGMVGKETPVGVHKKSCWRHIIL